MKNTLIALSLLLILGFQSCVKGQPTFTKLEWLSQLHSSMSLNGRKFLTSSETFIVANYSEDTRTRAKIDSFARSVSDSLYRSDKNITSTMVTFYKQSATTTRQNLKSNPRDLDRYSNEHDLRVMYKWEDRKPAGVFFYKNGTIVNP